MKKFLLLVMAVALVGCETMNDVGRHLVLADSGNGRSDHGISAEAKQQIDQANASAIRLQSDLQLAQKTANQVPDLQKQLAAYKSFGTPQKIKTKLDQLAKLELELQLTQKESKDRRVLLGAQLEQAKAGLQSAQNKIQKQETHLADITVSLQKVQQLAGYQNMGTPQQIKSKLDQLAKLKATQPGRIPGLPGVVPGLIPGPGEPALGGNGGLPGSVPGIDPSTGVPFPDSGGTGTLPLGPKQVGKIVNHDPQLNFYVINAGSDKGIKIGDKLTVYRENKAVGKIKISRVQPTVSIAKIDNTSPNPLSPFKPGDKVMKIK